MNVLWVALGGAVGSMCRYAVGSVVNKWIPISFPLSVLFVNVLGCFLLGIVSSLLLFKQIDKLLIVGFLGSLTTFSAFAYHSCFLLNNQLYGTCVVHILCNNLLSIGSFFLGKYVLGIWAI